MSRVKPLTREEIDADMRLQREKVWPAMNGCHETNRLALEFRAGGLRSSSPGGGRSAGGPSDPTAGAVLALNSADDAEDSDDSDTWHGPEVTEAYAAMWAAAWREHRKSGQRLVQLHTMMHSHADHQDRVTASRILFCVNPWCGDDLILDDGKVPRRGRCDPCNEYLDRHDRDAPKSVITDRRRKRTERASA